MGCNYGGGNWQTIIKHMANEGRCSTDALLAEHWLKTLFLIGFGVFGKFIVLSS